MYLPHRRHHHALLLTFFTLALIVFAWGCGYHKKKSIYIIGRDPTWYQANLVGKTEEITAFTNALLNEIGNKKLRLVDSDPLSIFRGLEDKEFHGILSSLSPEGANQESFDFSDPFLLLGPVLILPKDSAATSLEDLQEKIVGLSPYDESILIVQKIPSIIIKKYENMPSALEELSRGEIDGVLLDNLEAYALIPHLYSDKLRIASKPLDNSGLRLIVLKNTQDDLLSFFNEGLKKSIESGDYEKLRQQFRVN